MTKFSVIIPAGGSGSRFGGKTKKQFLQLKGKTLLEWTLKVFLSTPEIDQIIVAIPEEDLNSGDLLFDERIQYVAGGSTRSASVHRGFQALNNCQPTDLVLVHDAARPFASQELIQRIKKATQDHGVAIPAIPLSDTIKEIDHDGFVQKTIQRDQLRSVQTPQGFLYGNLHRAYQELDFEDQKYTDESMLMEALGHKVKIVEGEGENVKITTPFDLMVAKTVLDNLP